MKKNTKQYKHCDYPILTPFWLLMRHMLRVGHKFIEATDIKLTHLHNNIPNFNCSITALKYLLKHLLKHLHQDITNVIPA